VQTGTIDGINNRKWTFFGQLRTRQHEAMQGQLEDSLWAKEPLWAWSAQDQQIR
jgi:hypothetical protein